jgi:hypothetical protein
VFGDLDRLERVAPTGIERATERKAEFEEQCRTLEHRIESTRATEEPEELRAEIADLESQIGQLSPERVIKEIDEELRRHLRSGVRTEFGSVEVRSRFDQPFTLTNLPTDYREVELPPSGDVVHVEDCWGLSIFLRGENPAVYGKEEVTNCHPPRLNSLDTYLFDLLAP